MIEVADLEVQEKIKIIETFFTWPHYEEKGKFTSAAFVRSEDNKPYLVYCPKASASMSINEEMQYGNFWFSEGIREIKLTQTLNQVNGVIFRVIPLEMEHKKVSRADIESMFCVKVVD